jgi:hypothetical protein
VTSEIWQDLVAVADDAIEFAPELPRVGPPSIVTAEEFIAVDEPGAAALVGDDENALIAEGSNVMFYGDGGAGKTTLTIDASCHLAAGDDWLTMSVARAARVLVVENEGPRPLFRKKVARKLNGWAGSPLGDRLLLWEEPWANFTFADETHRQTLASAIREREVDVVVIGPLTASGMDDAGTLQQTQVQKTLGRASDGWNRQRAERELGKLLDKVERERWRKPTGERLSTLVDEFLGEYLPSRGRRRSTVLDYTNTLRRHVLPAVGDVELRELEARPGAARPLHRPQAAREARSEDDRESLADAARDVRVRATAAQDDEQPRRVARAALGTAAGYPGSPRGGDRRAAQCVPGEGRRGRVRGAGMVGARASADRVRARHRPTPRRDPRAALVGRGVARAAAACAALVRPR